VIELNLNTALMLYLGVTMGILLSLWIFSHYSSRRQKISIIEQELLICEYCHCAYLSDLNKTISQCPQCQSFNKPQSNKN